MFKNLTLFRIEGELPELAALDEAMQARPFAPAGPTMTRSSGWISPRSEGGAMVESVDGHWIAKVMIETRSVPAAMVKRVADTMADIVEKETGRQPRGKAFRELKEHAELELLPRAFPKVSTVLVWIDTKSKIIAIDATSSSATDPIAMMLIDVAPKLNLHDLHTVNGPAGAMSAWLVEGEPPQGFTLDREAELKEPGGEKATVRYVRQAVDTDEVAEHVRQGKVPTKVALTHEGRVSFVLTDTLRLKRVECIDADPVEGADAFDADVAISTGTLAPAIAALVDALGGIEVPPILVATEGTPAVHLEGDGPDPMLDQARAVVLEHRRGSISLVQRHLRIGYNRAARLLEALEAAGIVSPMQSDGSRTIITEKHA